MLSNWDGVFLCRADLGRQQMTLLLTWQLGLARVILSQELQLAGKELANTTDFLISKLT